MSKRREPFYFLYFRPFWIFPSFASVGSLRTIFHQCIMLVFKKFLSSIKWSNGWPCCWRCYSKRLARRFGFLYLFSFSCGRVFFRPFQLQMNASHVAHVIFSLVLTGGFQNVIASLRLVADDFEIQTEIQMGIE